MAKKSTLTTEYFATVKTLNDVREIVVNNIDKIDDADFLKQYKKAYNANRENRVGKYGKYTKKASVTADGFIKIVNAVKAITDIKVNNRKIKLTVSFKKGGINLHGDTKVIRKLLKDMGFRWNPQTEDWYGSWYDDAPTFVDIPKTVKTEAPKTGKAATKTSETPKTSTKVVDFAAKKQAKKTGKAKLADPVTITDPETKKAIFAERAARVKALKQAEEKAKGNRA